MSASLGVRLRRYWVAGILVLAPTALTLWVVWRLFNFFDNILGAQLRARGISVVGLGFVLLNLILLLLGALPAFSQNCALCYTQAASSGSKMISALKSGILILIAPPTLGTIAMMFVVNRRRKQVRRTEDDGEDW